eukprot:c13577_g1_i1 orf=163-858(+)
MIAQAATGMAGLSTAHLECTLLPPAFSSSSSSKQRSVKPSFLVIQARSSAASDDAAVIRRRGMLGLLTGSAAVGLFMKELAHAEASAIKIYGPPPPSGGLPGTQNSDQASDVDLPLKRRFYIQPVSPSEAAARAKESAKEIVGVKSFIDKKAWPYVQNDLRLRASYLRYDLNTIISSKPKEEKKNLKFLASKLYSNLDSLDYAARSKNTPQAEKYYNETVASLNEVLAKIA